MPAAVTTAAALARASVETPLGRMLIACNDAGLTLLSLPGEDEAAFARAASRHTPTVPAGEAAARHAALAAEELRAYFAGDLRRFSVPLAPHGTVFQRLVWDAVGAVPYGETATYGAIAARLNRPRAARAVGHANGANPLPIVIPCHRLVGHNGALTGYAGGLAMKRWLIDHERAHTGASVTAD